MLVCSFSLCQIRKNSSFSSPKYALIAGGKIRTFESGTSAKICFARYWGLPTQGVVNTLNLEFLAKKAADAPVPLGKNISKSQPNSALRLSISFAWLLKPCSASLQATPSGIKSVIGLFFKLLNSLFWLIIFMPFLSAKAKLPQGFCAKNELICVG